MRDVIAYRKLERADFRGEQPPPGFDHRMGAAICAYFQNNVDADTYVFEYLGLENYRHIYRVSFRNPRIWALMDRDCSWWNPGVDEDLSDYVLEHEEVHFALFEIAARKLTARLEAAEFRIVGSDETELKNDLQTQFDRLWKREQENLAARNLEFDEQTSAVFDPDVQHQWLARVRLELSAVAGTAPSPTAGGCGTDGEARAALDRARLALETAGRKIELTGLIEEAEAAALPPECDSIRARILADKVYRLAAE
jgi:hypothetical protein